MLKSHLLTDVDMSGENHRIWKTIPAIDLPLEPVPQKAVDPSKYIRDTVSLNDIGLAEAVKFQSIHDSELIRIRLEWRDPSRDDEIRDGDEFVDKAAVMFPLEPGASAMSMGSDQSPVNLWFWRADRTGPYDVEARGMGTTERREPEVSNLTCRAEYENNHWTVTFQRPLAVDEPACVDLSGRGSIGVTVAVWAGSNRERGPMKSFSGEFQSLRFSSSPHDVPEGLRNEP